MKIKFKSLFFLLVLISSWSLLQGYANFQNEDSLKAVQDTLQSSDSTDISPRDSLEYYRNRFKSLSDSLKVLRTRLMYIRDSIESVSEFAVSKVKEELQRAHEEELRKIREKYATRIGEIEKRLDSLLLHQSEKTTLSLEEPLYQNILQLLNKSEERSGLWGSFVSKKDPLFQFKVKLINWYLGLFEPEFHSAELQKELVLLNLKNEEVQAAQFEAFKLAYLYPGNKYMDTVTEKLSSFIKNEEAEPVIQLLNQKHPDLGYQGNCLKLIQVVDSLALHELDVYLLDYGWRYIKRFPETGADMVLKIMAGLYRYRGEIEKALYTLSWIERLYPDSPLLPGVAFEIAEIYERDRESYEEAISYYNRYLEQFPGDSLNPLALLRIARIYEHKLKVYLGASESYKKLCLQFPNSQETPDALFCRGQLLRKKLKDTREALQDFLRFVKQYPDDPRAPEVLMTIGELYLEQEQPEEAAKYLGMVFAKYQDSDLAPRSLLKLAEIQESKLGNIDAALAAYQNIVEYYPDSKEYKTALKKVQKLSVTGQ